MLDITEDNTGVLDGLQAQLWDFRGTHETLILKLSNRTSETTSEDVGYLHFLFLERIELGTFWTIKDAKLMKQGELIIYQDAHTKILCKECALFDADSR
jgi:hypothetical protein